MIRCEGAAAWVTPSVQVRQAYFGRTVTPLAHVNMRCRAADDAQLRRHDVQPLAAVFADPVHDAAAARADQAGGFDDLFDAWKPRRQIADGALRRGFGRAIARLSCPRFLFRLNLGQRDGQVFERQLPFILGQLFRPLAVQGMVQLSDPLAESGLSSNHERQMLLPTGDFCQRRHRFHQRQNGCTLRGLDGRKVGCGCGFPGLELP